MNTYQILNKELVSEVQKLRLKIQEHENEICMLKNLNRDMECENLHLRGICEKIFSNFYQYSAGFFENFAEIGREGIELNLAQSTTQSRTPASNRNSSKRLHQESENSQRLNGQRSYSDIAFPTSEAAPQRLRRTNSINLGGADSPERK